MSHCNFVLLQSVGTEWVGFIPLNGFSIQQYKFFKVSIVKRVLPTDLAIFFFFQSCPWCLASGLCSVLFLVPGIYMETDVYDDVYVRLLMTPYLRQKSHYVRQPYWILKIQFFLSVITSPKNTFFQKYDLFLIQLGQIFPKSQ